MTSIEPALSFEATRRRHLIEATIETLADVGFKAASLSEIARRAKVSTGLFAHYFQDKDGLLEATLRFMAARLTRSTSLKLRSAVTQRERLFAVGEAALADEEFDRRTSAVWLAVWGQMTHSERYQRVQHIYQRRMISNLRNALRGLVPQDRVGAYAVLIAATIDGLWLRSHVSGPVARFDVPDTADSRVLLRSLIGELLAGAGSGRSPAPDPTPISEPDRAAEMVFGRDSVAVARVACPGAAQANAVVRAAQVARRGLEDWGALPAPDRARVLRRCADMLRAEGPALARLESEETGRPLRATAGSDLIEAIAHMDRAADLAIDMRTVRVELDGGRVGESRYRPGSLVATDIHWSRPVLDICVRAQALALGDALLVHSDPHASETVGQMAALFTRAGLPEGTLTLVGGGPGTMRLLAAHSDRCEADRAFEPEPEKDQATLFGYAGPKAATVVLPGADLEQAARSVLLGCRAWTGSTYSSQNRIYVHDTIRRRFADSVAAAAAALRIGDPLAKETQIGRLLSRRQGNWIAALLAVDLRAGAQLVGGCRTLPPGAPDEPVWLAPIVVDGCNPVSALVRAETFAPVVTLLPFAEDAGLAALARDDPSTAVGLFSDEAERAYRAAAVFDRPLSFVNDDGLGEVPRWAAEGRPSMLTFLPTRARLRRIVVADGRFRPEPEKPASRVDPL